MKREIHWILRIYDRLGAEAGDLLVMAMCVIAVAVVVVLAVTGNF